MSYFCSLLIEIPNFESETPIRISSKKGKKTGCLGVKKDKPQPVIYGPFMGIRSKINKLIFLHPETDARFLPFFEDFQFGGSESKFDISTNSEQK